MDESQITQLLKSQKELLEAAKAFKGQPATNKPSRQQLVSQVSRAVGKVISKLVMSADIESQGLSKSTPHLMRTCLISQHIRDLPLHSLT